MNRNAAIGVFDSGVGGLTVVRELVKLMPNENLIYFGDTARAPYGSRPPGQIIDFMHQILRFFVSQNVKMAIYACNTMTALGLESARKMYPIPLVGMNTGIKAALKATKNKNIGVIATQATIASGKHGKTIKTVDPGATIYPQACPKFVPLIEQGELSGPLIEEAALEYLLPLKEGDVDALILGCTHYPLVSDVLLKIMGSHVALIDPAGETVQDAKNALAKVNGFADNGPGKIRLCFSADIPRAKKFAESILPGTQMEFVEVKLQD